MRRPVTIRPALYKGMEAQKTIKEDEIMSLRINTNVAAINAHRHLLDTASRLSRSMAKLSSGYRISRAADDAAGLAIANTFRAEVRALRVNQQNASQAVSLLQVAEGGATQIESMIERLIELANQAASTNTGGTSNTEREKINTEAAKILEEIDRIANSTKWQDTVILNNASFVATFQVGTENNSNNRITVTLNKSLTSSGLGISTINLSNLASAQAAITTLNNVALASVNVYLADIGAYQNRIEFAASNIAVGIENKSAAESVIRDVDMAWEMVLFTKNQILMQSGTAMLAQANLVPQNVLALLGR